MENLEQDGRRPASLQNWQSWLDKTIAEAEQRGDFENLPGHGKPLHFDANPLTGEIDVGHGILKNAGMAPAWIELGKEIRAGYADLEAIIEDTRNRLASGSFRPTPTPPARQSWWRTLLAGRPRPEFSTPRPSAFNPEMIRAQAREKYLERAHQIDQKIVAYNGSIPPALWQLERPRLTAERAVRDFDEACPP